MEVVESINSSDTIACRIPDEEWIINLIKKMNKPLYVTSANISGSENLLKYQDVIDKVNADAIVKIDAKGKEASTIVDTLNGYKILREGPIKQKQIEEAIK